MNNELRNVWVAEEKRKADEEEAKAQLKKKLARKGNPEDKDAADTADIVESGAYDFLGSALGAVLHNGDGSVPVVKAKSTAKRNSSGSANSKSAPKKSRLSASP